MQSAPTNGRKRDMINYTAQLHTEQEPEPRPCVACFFSEPEASKQASNPPMKPMMDPTFDGPKDGPNDESARLKPRRRPRPSDRIMLLNADANQPTSNRQPITSITNQLQHICFWTRTDRISRTDPGRRLTWASLA